MAVLNFPAFPNNGDVYVENGITYTYSGTAPNGFWQADNKNSAPQPDPDVVVDSITLQDEAGIGNAVAVIDNVGRVTRGDASTAVTGPYALKAGDTFTGDVLVSNNGRIGIGTNAPSDPIDINTSNPSIELDNNATGTAGVIFSSGGVADGAVVYNNSADRLELYTGDIAGNPQAVIAADGKFGVGTANPLTTFEVTGDDGLQISKEDSSRKWNLIPTSQLLLTEQVTENTVVRVTTNSEVGLGGDPTLFAKFNHLTAFGTGTDTGITLDSPTEAGIQFSKENDPKASFVYNTVDNKATLDTKGYPVILKDVGNVGINIENPTSNLEVAGTVKFVGNGLTIRRDLGSIMYVGSSDGANGIVGTENDAPLIFKTGNVNKVTISDAGNVTAISHDAQPQFLFADTAAGTDNAGAGFTLTTSADDAVRRSDLVLNASGGDLSAASAFSIGNTGEGNTEIDGGIGDFISFGFGGTKIARLISQGKFILGATDVGSGDVTIVGATDNVALTLQNSVTGTGLTQGSDIQVDSNADLNVIQHESDSNIRFKVDATEALHINGQSATENTQVIIGGETPRSGLTSNVLLTVGDAAKSTAEMEIRSNISSKILFTNNANPASDFGSLEYTSTGSMNFQTDGRVNATIGVNGQFSTYSTDSTAVILSTNKVSGSSDTLLEGYASATAPGGVGGVNRIKIFSNGDVENTNNAYGALSDIKLKKNIEAASSQWDDVKALSLRKYDFKNPQLGEGRQLGLIAQEVQAISPGLVRETPDYIRTETPVFDENGAPLLDENGDQVIEVISNPTGETTLSVKYSVLYLKAIGALQEAMTRIEELEAKVAALES